MATMAVDQSTLVEIDKAKAAADAAAEYELMLHSLTHTHTQAYLDRHVLIFEKWCRDYNDGLYIRDLRFVISVLQVFKERFIAHPAQFRKVFGSILKLCAKPLLECKANERRSKQSWDNISEFYKVIVDMFSYTDSRLKADVGRCLRCIVHCGKDPSVLRADQIEWTSDGNRVQLLDASFVQSLMRQSGSLAVVVKQYLTAVDEFQAGIKEYNQMTGFSKEKDQHGSTQAGRRQSTSGRGGDSDDEDFSVGPSTARGAGTGTGASAGSRAGAADGQAVAAGVGQSSTKDEDDDMNSSKMDVIKSEVSSTQALAQVMLDLCMDFAAHDKSAALMCRLGVCDGAVKLIDIGANDSPKDERDSRMPIAVDLMWTVLESYLNQGKAENDEVNYASVNVMNFEKSVAVLLELFLRLLRDGYRLSDKECRNEVAIVLTLIVNFPAASPFFVQSGVLITFVTYACVAEAGRKAWPFYPRPLAKSRNFANIFDIDIQFKQILWISISDILDLNDIDALLCVAASPLIPSLMSYLEHDSSEPGRMSIDATRGSLQESSAGSPTKSTAAPVDDKHAGTSFIKQLSLPQLRELQVQAIKFLSKNVNKVIGEFLRIHGISRMLDMTCRYYQSSIPEHKKLIYQSLVLLKRCVIGSNIVKSLLTEENAIQTFLFLLEYSDEDNTRSLAARLIAILCSGPNRVCQEQLRTQDGIKILVSVMHAYSLSRKPLVGRKAGLAIAFKGEGDIEDPWEDFRAGDVPILIVAVLDCIHSGIVGNARNEVCLASEEGIDKLLELLEVSPFVLRTPVLRLLSDLLENSLLMSVLQAWRSRKTLRSSAQILAHCWLDEECRLDGRRDKGVLANLQHPLGNHSWPIDPRIPTSTDGQAVPMGGNGELDAVRSLTVTKLASAILEGRNVAHGSVPMNIRGQVLEKDIRAILASIFEQIGIFGGQAVDGDDDLSSHLSALQEGDEGNEEDNSLASQFSEEPIVSSSGEQQLSPSDNQVLSVAQRFQELKSGEWWRATIQQLQQLGVRPIEADMALIDRHMESSFDAAMAAQLEQMELEADEKRMKQKEEKGFNDQLITQKNHQIKTEWLKRNRKNKAAAVHTKKLY